MTGTLAAQSGPKIGCHNHFWEFRIRRDGNKGLDISLDNTLVVFELDLFWSEKSGLDYDVQPVMECLPENTADLQHVFVDQDTIRTAPYERIEKSYQYMKTELLG